MAAEIIKVYKEHLPAVRFIGKCYSDKDRDNDGGFSSTWQQWINNCWFDILMELPRPKGIESGYLGLSRISTHRNSLQYWIGLMLDEKTTVPEGYEYIDLPEGDVGVCWLYDKKETLFEEELFFKCIKKFNLNEMKVFGEAPHDSGVVWKYFFERYNHRFFNEDENGKVILDYGIYLYSKEDKRIISEKAAKLYAEKMRRYLVFIPDNCIVDKKHVFLLNNTEFVRAFKELQQLIAKMYENIEEAPFSWGYPEDNIADERFNMNYNRLEDILFELVLRGIFRNNTLVVDMKRFRAAMKKHKMIDLIVGGLIKHGFVFHNFNRKSDSFTVSYPSNPPLLQALYAYVNALDIRPGPELALMKSFSYRYIEAPGMQEKETVYLAKMDQSSVKLQEIQEFIYEKAKEYGYKIYSKKPINKNCIFYKKGSKHFIHVGEKDVDGRTTVFAKVIFRSVFLSDKDKVNELAKSMPGVFGVNKNSNCTKCNGFNKSKKPCIMRIDYELDGKNYKNCAFNSFYFYNPTLDNIKSILELYIMENK